LAIVKIDGVLLHISEPRNNKDTINAVLIIIYCLTHRNTHQQYRRYNTNTTMEEMDCSSIVQTGDSAFASLDFLLSSEEETITLMGHTTQEDNTTDNAYRI
jgi:hypothetical protein